MDFSLADFHLLLTFVTSIAATFMTHDSRIREEVFGVRLSQSCVITIGAFAILNAPIFNEAYFHFSGIPGLVVVSVLVCTIFVYVPHRLTDMLCDRFLFKDIAIEEA